MPLLPFPGVRSGRYPPEAAAIAPAPSFWGPRHSSNSNLAPKVQAPRPPGSQAGRRGHGASKRPGHRDSRCLLAAPQPFCSAPAVPGPEPRLGGRAGSVRRARGGGDREEEEACEGGRKGPAAREGEGEVEGAGRAGEGVGGQPMSGARRWGGGGEVWGRR